MNNVSKQLRPDRLSILALTVFLLGGLAITNAVAFIPGYGGVAACLILIFLLCMLGPCVPMLRQGNFEHAEPINFISAAFLLYFVIGPTYCIATGQFLLAIAPSPELLVSALLLVALAPAACITGYFSPLGGLLGPKPSRNRHYHDRRRGMLYAISLEALGIAMFCAWLWTAGLSFSAVNALGVDTDYSSRTRLAEVSPSSYLHPGEGFLLPAALLMFAFRPRGAARYLVYLNLLAILAFYTITGTRWRLMLYLFALLLLARLTSAARLGLARFSVAAAIFCCTMPVLGYYRSITGTLKTTAMDSQAFTRSTMSSISIFDTFLAIVDNVPTRIGYLYGDVIGDVIISPVPRSIWPDKPFPREAEVVWDLTGGRAVGFAMPAFGEYYVNFGPAGLVAGMFAIGVLARAIYMRWRRSPANSGNILLLATSAPYLINVIDRGYLPAQVANIFNIFLPLILGTLIARRSIPRSSLVPNWGQNA